MAVVAEHGGSLWAATHQPVELTVDAELPSAADVVVVGAGYTGLWTALHLARRLPDTSIVVVERQQVGFGASGRNGGWCSALLPIGPDALSARHGREAAAALQRAMFDTVDAIGAFAAGHPQVGWAAGGTIAVARSGEQEQRLRADVDEARRLGIGADDLRWLAAGETEAVVTLSGSRGGVFSPHCAAVHPLALAEALAMAATEAGVRICAPIAVTAIDPGAVRTDRGDIDAEVVVIGNEAYRTQLPGLRRSVLPIYSLMIGSEPLSADRWAEIGLAERTTFTDGRRTIIYGQRTADGRLAFGGRGAPYHFGSRIAPGFDRHEVTRRRLEQTVIELFPQLGALEFPFHWGGPLAVPRDWHPFVRYDRRAGVATAGGYVGDGVATAHLAGATLADLIAGDETPRTALPIVGHQGRDWEPEPLRWLGARLGALAADRADRGPGAALWARLFDRLR